MSTITQAEGEKILKPLYEFIVNTYNQAFSDWKNVVRMYPDLGARVKACFINDQVRSYTRKEFSHENIIEGSGRFFLVLGNIAGRYKKLKKLLPLNIPTQESLKIEGQQLELGEALERLTIVNFGYIPIKGGIDYRFVITCIKDKKVLWQIPLSKEFVKEVEILEADKQEEQTKKKRVHKKAQ
jgi:hypothetical protein